MRIQAACQISKRHAKWQKIACTVRLENIKHVCETFPSPAKHTS